MGRKDLIYESMARLLRANGTNHSVQKSISENKIFKTLKWKGFQHQMITLGSTPVSHAHESRVGIDSLKLDFEQVKYVSQSFSSRRWHETAAT